MFYFDIQYMLWVVIPTMLISGGASLLVRAAFSHYSKIPGSNRITGAQAAQRLLDYANIHDVSIVRTQGYLSDHYDPTNKRLALSPAVYDGISLASVGVATHEAGHAIQHATNYMPLGLRSALVPLAGIGSNLGMIVMFIGLFLYQSVGVLGQWVVIAGAVLFCGVLAFQLVTLPVEFDASARAKRLVVEAGIIRQDEQYGVNRVLNAAALTYVAAVVSTLLTLVYFLMRSGLLGGRRSD